MEENFNNENEDIVFNEVNEQATSNGNADKVDAVKNIVNDYSNKAKDIFLKNKKYCIIGVAILGIIILLAIILSIINSGKVGNTTGNLANAGFAAGKDNEIYYTHLEDGEVKGIYKSKGDKVEEIIDEEALYLNVDGGYIYCIMEDEDSSYKTNLVKMKKNGKKQDILVKDIDEDTPITVADGWVYYAKDGNFYKIKTNGKDRKKISNKDILQYQIEGNWIYYSYYKDGEYTIAKIKTNGKDNKKIIDDFEQRVSFFVDGNTIYYVESEYNEKKYEYTYKLNKVKTNGKKPEEICKLKGSSISVVNMNKEGVFYSSTGEDYEEYDIYLVDYKGKEHKKITKTTANPQINIVGDYVVYNDLNKDDEMTMFKIKINGKDKVELKD